MKASSIFEKVILAAVAIVIAAGTLFGVIAVSGLKSVIRQKDAVISMYGDDLASVRRIKALADAKSAAALHFMITGYTKPYLNEMNGARNELLETLRTLRGRLPTEETTKFLDKIEAADMELQLALTKGIDARRAGPNFIAISSTLENLAQPKRAELAKLVDNFVKYKETQIGQRSANVKNSAAATSTNVRRTLFLSAAVALAAGVGAWLLIAQMLFMRRRRETAALRNEHLLRSTLDAARVVTWQRDLTSGQYLTKDARHLGLFGFTKEPPLWNFETFLRTVVPADRDRVKATIHGALERKENYAVEFKVQWPDKSIHLILSKGCLEVDEHGVAVALCGFDTNIDEIAAAGAPKTEGEESSAPVYRSANRPGHA